MKRTATLNLKGLDPDVLDAARDVARRAGIPLETWIASVVESGDEKPATRRKRGPVQPAAASPPSLQNPTSRQAPARERPAQAQPSRDHAAKTAAPMQAAPKQPVAPAPVAMEAADPFAAAIAQMLQRLDAIDEKIDGTQKVAREATTSSVAGNEARTSTVDEGDIAPVTATDERIALDERLALIERRMIEFGEQLTQPRALGRRGRPIAVEMADAVGEIRQRQRELEEREGAVPAGPNAVAAMQRNVAAGMGAGSLGAGSLGAGSLGAGTREGTTASQSPSPVISELQVETSRLREAVGALATGQDINALELAMLSLASGVQQAQKPADLAAIVKPIEMIQVQISRLADDVAENVHARVAGDVERLAVKFDRALSAGPSGHADRDAMGDLFGEIEEIRRLIASLAGPERIQSLAQGLQALSAQIAKLQDNTAEDSSRMAELRPLLEEIRSGLKAPKAEGIEKQIQAMGKKLDALRSQPPSAGHASEAIIDRIDALADKVDRVGVNPVGDLIGRLEDLGETLRRPAVPGGDLATIHAMLHDLADKVDRVGGGHGSGDGLDALEKQIIALSQRLDTRGTDPAIAGLERAMNDLLAQVATPADRRDDNGIGSLRDGLAELRSQQAAAEQRMQATLNGVHATLDRLTAHFAGAATEVRAPAAAMAEPAAPAPAAPRQPTATRRPEIPRGPATPQPETPAEWSRPKDEILEPGAARPNRARAPAEPEAAPANSEIKSNFIAAARRAALAAQAEAAEIAPRDRVRAGQRQGTPQSSPQSTPDEGTAEDGLRMPSRAAQMRAGLDKRRKHLLLGLAAIVLALGTAQAIRVWAPAEAPAPDTKPVALAPEAAPAKSASAPVESAASEPAPAPLSTEAARPEPQTTQAIPVPTAPPPASGNGQATASEPVQDVKPAQQGIRQSVPKIADMSALAADLAGVPSGLGGLKKAALAGDGAAIYDLASRQADGRGLTRDLAVAAKLFEKLAAAGFAPAQYKLAGQYEKGLGLTRDLVQAKLWYGRAAEQGNVRSMHNLAVIYAENPSASGKPDFATAAQWFRRGAEYGVRDSQYNLAVLHARGLGVPQDLMQSYLWFSAAAAQGDDDAAKKRDDVAGKLTPKDLATARGLATSFKAKPVEAFTNEAPGPAGPAAMTLLGAPAPAATPAPRRI